jgi:hypothetical protein
MDGRDTTYTSFLDRQCVCVHARARSIVMLVAMFCFFIILGKINIMM